MQDAIGPYRLVKRIRKGGMAEVYRALDPVSGDPVALKLMAMDESDEPDGRSRFAHEVKAHRQLQHPNVVRLIDAGEAEGQPYLVMELVEGMSLKELLTLAKRLPVKVAIYIVREILKGLDYAHERGLVHRDVKPSNVMLGLDGSVKITDFGISRLADTTRLTMTGHILGTPSYMSPEQARGEYADRRSDLFCVGIILYEALTGVNPFRTDHPAVTVNRVIEQKREPLFELNPALPAEVETLVDNLLAGSVVARYQDAAEVLSDLETAESILEGERFDASSLAEFVKNPAAAAATMDSDEAEQHYLAGIALYREGKGEPERAIWELYQAVCIDAGHEAARQALELVASERGYRLEATTDPAIMELKERLDADPENVNLLLRLARLYKQEGNLLQVIRCFVRIRKLRAGDPYMIRQAVSLVGPENVEVFDRTRSRIVRRRDRDETAPNRIPFVLPEREPRSFLKSLVSAMRDPRLLLMLLLTVAVGGVIRYLVMAGRPDPNLSLKPGELTRELEAFQGGVEAPLLPRDEAMLKRARAVIGRRPRLAEGIYRRFLREFPSNGKIGEAYLGLGRALEAQGRREEALAVTGEGLASIKNTNRLRDCRRFRARMFEVMGDADGALRELSAIQAMNIKKFAVEAKSERCRLLRRVGRLREALDEIDELRGFYPGAGQTTEIRLLRADLLILVGRGREAIPELEAVKASHSMDSKVFKKAQKLIEKVSGSAS